MSEYYKYPRTMHLPWSNGTTSNDRIMHDISPLIGKEVVVTEKLDGENCLAPDSVLITEFGEMTIKEICETKYTGNVLSFDIVNNSQEYMRVIDHKISDTLNTDEWYEIEFENGKKIEITGNHYIYLSNFDCYRKVSDLTINDDVLCVGEV